MTSRLSGEQPRLIEDAFGEIRRILITLPDYALREFGGAIRSVLDTLPDRIALDVLVSQQSDTGLDAWATHRPNCRLHPAPEGLEFSHWAQDAVVGMTEGAAPSLLLSSRFERHDDAAAATHLAQAANLALHMTDLPLDGGNVLAMGPQLLLGADMIAAPDGHLACDPQRQVLSIGAKTVRAPETTVTSSLLPDWREVQRTGVGEDQSQPLFHLDLFIAPAGMAEEGRPRWLVGCPRLGAECLGLPLLDHADAGLFDAVAALLQNQGSIVIRTPMPLIWTDQQDQRLRTWYHLPTNNVIVEITDTASHVWLPQFAAESWPELARIDQANRAIWEGLGFTTTPVPGCLPLAERRGALRCMLNVVERG
ncbi:MAG: hypothetical protein AAGC81_17475 [Pseudomonadota bacterium]